MKYIDADHLKVEMEKHIKEVKDAAKRFTPNLGFFDAKLSGIYDVMAIIDSLQQEQPEVFDTMAFQKGVKEGKRLVIETIRSRIDEILGDAQPAPILRVELQELIKKIEK